jgi:hypothetical protein
MPSAMHNLIKYSWWWQAGDKQKRLIGTKIFVSNKLVTKLMSVNLHVDMCG